MVLAEDGREPDLLGEDLPLEHACHGRLGALEPHHPLTGPQLPAVVGFGELLGGLEEMAGVVEVVMDQVVQGSGHGALPGVDPQRGGRMEVDAVGCREPAAPSDWLARRVAERPREGPAEALDRVVAGSERGLGD